MTEDNSLYQTIIGTYPQKDNEICISSYMANVLYYGKVCDELGNAIKLKSVEDVLGKKEQTAPGKTQSKTATAGTKVSAETKQTGRPEKADDQKSEKTIQNKESMS